MRIPVVDGRGLASTDVKGAEPVCLVNEAFAARFWPGQKALGKRIARGDSDEWRTVVGVVHDAKAFNPDAEPAITVYHSIYQVAPNSRYVVVRSVGDPSELRGPVEHEIHALDPDLPVYDVATMDERFSTVLARRRFAMALLGTLAAVAVALAAVGIYGVLGYSVAQRTHEIGIRMALGARRWDVSRLVVRQALAMVALGIAAGLGAALVLTRAMASLLFGVSQTDAPTFAAVAGVLAVVALVASYVPARRATKVDPMVALRHD